MHNLKPQKWVYAKYDRIKGHGLSILHDWLQDVCASVHFIRPYYHCS